MEKRVSTITVNNSTALVSALKAAQSGDVIKLAAGDYAGFSVNNLNFTGVGVTVTSADLTHQAKMHGFSVETSSGMTFQGLELVASSSVATNYQVLKSSNITLDHLNIHGT